MNRLSGFVKADVVLQCENGEQYNFIEYHEWLKNGVIVEFELDSDDLAHKLSAFKAGRKYKVPESFMLSALPP